MPGTFSPQPRVSDPDMHHDTCMTHVPWWMSGSLTSDFLWSRWRGKRFRYSRRMHNTQFYVSGKRPFLQLLSWYPTWKWATATDWKVGCQDSGPSKCLQGDMSCWCPCRVICKCVHAHAYVCMIYKTCMYFCRVRAYHCAYGVLRTCAELRNCAFFILEA